jgi:hypothetical protein
MTTARQIIEQWWAEITLDVNATRLVLSDGDHAVTRQDIEELKFLIAQHIISMTNHLSIKLHEMENILEKGPGRQHTVDVKAPDHL